MKEPDIRDLDVFRNYLELSKCDANRIFSDKSSFEEIACPACDYSESEVENQKHGFTYVRCTACETLLASPMPVIADLQRFYAWKTHSRKAASLADSGVRSPNTQTKPPKRNFKHGCRGMSGVPTCN